MNENFTGIAILISVGFGLMAFLVSRVIGSLERIIRLTEARFYDEDD